MDLYSRALEGAAWAATHLAWAVGVLAILLVAAALAVGPVVAWRWAAYRLHIHRVTRRARRMV